MAQHQVAVACAGRGAGRGAGACAGGDADGRGSGIHLPAGRQAQLAGQHRQRLLAPAVAVVQRLDAGAGCAQRDRRRAADADRAAVALIAPAGDRAAQRDRAVGVQRAQGLVAAQLQPRRRGHLHPAAVGQALGGGGAQRAAQHLGVAGVGERGAAERELAAAGLLQRAGAADGLGQHDVVAALQPQEALVEQRAGAQAAASAAVAQLQRAGLDAGVAMALVGPQQPAAATLLDEAATAHQLTAEGGVAAVGAQRQLVGAQLDLRGAGRGRAQRGGAIRQRGQLLTPAQLPAGAGGHAQRGGGVDLLRAAAAQVAGVDLQRRGGQRAALGQQPQATGQRGAAGGQQRRAAGGAALHHQQRRGQRGGQVGAIEQHAVGHRQGGGARCASRGAQAAVQLQRAHSGVAAHRQAAVGQHHHRRAGGQRLRGAGDQRAGVDRQTRGVQHPGSAYRQRAAADAGLPGGLHPGVELAIALTDQLVAAQRGVDRAALQLGGAGHVQRAGTARAAGQAAGQHQCRHAFMPRQLQLAAGGHRHGGVAEQLPADRGGQRAGAGQVQPGGVQTATGTQREAAAGHRGAAADQHGGVQAAGALADQRGGGERRSDLAAGQRGGGRGQPARPAQPAAQQQRPDRHRRLQLQRGLGTDRHRRIGRQAVAAHAQQLALRDPHQTAADAVARQRQLALATLDQAAAGGGETTAEAGADASRGVDGEGVRAQRDVCAAAGQLRFGVGQRGDGGVAAQRDAGARGHLQRTRVGQALVAGGGQRAGQHAGGTAVQVVAAQRELAAAGLDQRTAGQRPAVGIDRQAEGIGGHAGVADLRACTGTEAAARQAQRQAAPGVEHGGGAGAELQRAAVEQQVAGAGLQRHGAELVVAADQQGARQQAGAAGIAVGCRAGELQLAGAGLDQAAAAAGVGQHAAVGQRVAGGDAQRAAGRAQRQAAPVGQHQAGGGQQRAAVQPQVAGTGRQRHGTQLVVGGDRQHALLDHGGAAEGAGHCPLQAELAGTGLDQRAGTTARTSARTPSGVGHDAGIGQRLAGDHRHGGAAIAQRQAAAGVELQRVIDLQRGAVQQQLAGGGHGGRAAELAVVADRQRAGQHPGGAGVVVVERVGQRQPPGTLLGEAAGRLCSTAARGSAVDGAGQVEPHAGRHVQRAAGIAQPQAAAGRQGGVDVDPQRAAVEHQLPGHRCHRGGAQLRVAADGQHAAEHLRGAAVGVGRGGQLQRAGTGLAQRTTHRTSAQTPARPIGQHAGQHQDLAGADLERGARGQQRDAAAGGQGEAVGGPQGAAVEQQVAGGGAGRGLAELGVGGHHQRATGQRGAAAVSVGRTEREAAGALLDQPAGARDHAGEGGVGARTTGAQRAAAQLQLAAAVAQHVGRAAGQGADGLGVLQRQHSAGAIGQHHAGVVGQRGAALQGQRAGRHRGAAGVGVAARQREAAGALLDQGAAAAEAAGEDGVGAVAAGAQGEAAQRQFTGQPATWPAHRGTAGHRAQGFVGQQDQPGAGAIGQHHRAAVGQGRAALQRQRAALHGGGAGVGVGAGQREAPGALLDESAAAADDAGVLAVGLVGAGGQREGAQRHAAARRAAASQRADGFIGLQHQADTGGIGQRQQRAVGQRRTAAQHQGARRHGGLAGVGVGTGQREAASALLDQPAAARHRAGQRGAGAIATGVQRERAQRQGAARRAAAGHRTHGLVGRQHQGGARGIGQRDVGGVGQRAAAGQHQRAAAHQGGAAVGVGAGQGQAAGTLFDQAAAAGQRAAVAAVGGVADHAEREAAQRHLAARGATTGQRAEGLVGLQLQRGGGRVGQRDGDAVGQCRAALQHQAAGLHRHRAGKGVGAAERQAASARFGEAAAAGQGAGIAAAGTAGAGGQREAAQVDRTAGRAAAGQGADAGIGLQYQRRANAVEQQHGAGRQRRGMGQHQAAGGHRGGAGVAAGAGQREAAAALLDHPAAAAESAGETAAGAVAAAAQRGRAQHHLAAQRTATGQRADGLGGQQHQAGAGLVGQAHGHTVVQRRAAGQLQPALVDRRTSGEGVHSAQREAAGAGLGQAARAADDAIKTAVAAVGTHGQREAVELHATAQRAAAGQRADRGVGLQRQRQAGHVGQQHRRAAGQRAGMRQAQRAGVQRGGAAIGVGPRQHQAAAAGLAEPTRAADDAVDRQAVGLRVDAAAAGAQHHRAVGRRGQVGGGQQLPARQPQRPGAGPEAAVGIDRQRAVDDGGAAAVGVGPRQREAARALLYQRAAAAGYHPGVTGVRAVAGGQRVAGQVDHAAAASAVQRGDGGRIVQRQADTRHVGQPDDACDQRLGVVQPQRAVIDGGDTAVGVGTGQRETAAAALLGKPTAAADDPLVTAAAGVAGGQRVARQFNPAVGRAVAGQRADGAAGLQCQPHTDHVGQRHGAEIQHIGVFERQRAGVHQRGAGVGVGAGQREGACTLLDQPAAIAADDTGEAGVAAVTGGQRVGTQANAAEGRAGQRRDGAAGVQRERHAGRVGQRHGAEIQHMGVAQPQRAAGHAGRRADGVGAAEADRAAGRLVQRHRARQHRTDRAVLQVIGGSAGQRAVADLAAGQPHTRQGARRAAEVEGAATDHQAAAGGQAGCGAQQQAAQFDGRRTGVGVGAGQCQPARALLGEPAAATDDPGKNGVGGGARAQRVGGQRDGAVAAAGTGQ